MSDTATPELPDREESATSTPPAAAPDRGEIARGAVFDAIAAAKERVERGEPIVPPESEPEDDAVSTTDAKAETKADDVPDGEGGESPETPPAEGETQGAPSEGTGDDGDVVVARLPGREANDPDVEIEIPKELEQDFNRLRNGYMRGEQVRRERAVLDEERVELRADKEELELIDRELTDDAAAFVLERVKSPEIRREILLNLLADDTTWGDAQLQEQLREWEEDEQKRHLFRASTENERLKQSRVREQAAEVRKGANEGVLETTRVLSAMVPADWDPATEREFHALALDRIAYAAGQRGTTHFTASEIVEIMGEKILRAYGIDPVAARDAAAPRTPPSAERRQVRRPAAKTGVVTEEEARAAGEKLKKESARRKAAAAYAPAGAGAPPATVELPKGQTVKERIAFVRERGLAALLGTKR